MPTVTKDRATGTSIGDAPLATITILFLVVVGAVDLLIDGTLSADYTRYLAAVDVPLAGLALGRGWAARKPS